MLGIEASQANHPVLKVDEAEADRAFPKSDPPVRFAQVVRLVQPLTAGPMHLEVDGEEFPFYVAPDIEVVMGRGIMAGVRLTLFAERLEVEAGPAEEAPG